MGNVVLGWYLLPKTWYNCKKIPRGDIVKSKIYRDRAMLRIGTTHINKSGHRMEIIELTDKRTKSGNVIFKGKFIESGYEFERDYKSIKLGDIKDYGRPSVYGVGYSYSGASHSPFHKTWCHMLERCYEPKTKAYKRYGGRGVKVSEPWLFFSNFEKDAYTLKNSDKFLNNPHEFSLDKDILGDGLLYSKETCMFASYLEQSHAQKRVRKIKSIDKEGNIQTFNSQMEAGRVLKLQSKNISKVLMNKRTHTGGYKFEFVEE